MRKSRLSEIIKEEIQRYVSHPHKQISVDGHSVDCELADDDASRMKGLMGRRNLADGEGMLFIFPRETQQSFWMRNTPLSLEVAFADASGQILNVEEGVPHSEEKMLSAGPAKFVLEVPLGWCRNRGIGPGSRLQFKD